MLLYAVGFVDRVTVLFAGVGPYARSQRSCRTAIVFLFGNSNPTKHYPSAPMSRGLGTQHSAHYAHGTPYTQASPWACCMYASALLSARGVKVHPASLIRLDLLRQATLHPRLLARLVQLDSHPKGHRARGAYDIGGGGRRVEWSVRACASASASGACAYAERVGCARRAVVKDEEEWDGSGWGGGAVRGRAQGNT